MSDWKKLEGKTPSMKFTFATLMASILMVEFKLTTGQPVDVKQVTEIAQTIVAIANELGITPADLKAETIRLVSNPEAAMREVEECTGMKPINDLPL